MVKKYKRVKVENCVRGQRYYVECGIWQATVLYVGLVGKKYLFTFGDDVNYWEHQLNICSFKSRLKVYELEVSF